MILTPHLGVELTQKCNLNCSHCFRGKARNINISRDIIEKVFEEVKYVGVLDLSGGEVFLGYEQLNMILDVAKEKNVIIKNCSMLTNGTIYDERMYILLDEYFGEKYQVGISDDDFHDKSIRRVYGKQIKNSENPGLNPKSINDVKSNMYKHIFNKHWIGFQRVSNRLINNGRAVNVQTPHKEFEALGYYFNNSLDSNMLLVGPMIFVGADGFISDINSDIDKRKEQSLGNINENTISNFVLNGGKEIEFKDINEFFSLMRNRENDFGTYQGEHLGFKDGKIVPVEYKIDEEYYKALEGLPSFCDRAFEAIKEGKIEEFLMKEEYFKLYPYDLSQIDHEDYRDGR